MRTCRFLISMMDYTKSPPNYELTIIDAATMRASTGSGNNFASALKDALDNALSYADSLNETNKPF